MTIQKGFTLIELLVVIIVLSILLSVVVPKFGDSTELAKVSSSLSMLQTLRKQLDLARVEHDEYYPNLGSGGSGWDVLLYPTIPSSPPNGNYTITDKSQLHVGPYIKNRPINLFEDSDKIAAIDSPAPGIGFLYNQNSGQLKMVIAADKIIEYNLNNEDFAGY